MPIDLEETNIAMVIPTILESDPCLMKGLALSLGARDVAGWSSADEAVVEGIPPLLSDLVGQVRARIQNDEDPLGEIFCHLRTSKQRRGQGATYTPLHIVRAMVDWSIIQEPDPARIVEPGAGSAVFLREAGKAFPHAKLIGIEIDPLAALIARANLAASGLAHRSLILCGDYRTTQLPECTGKTLFIGNPPYVRHHQIAPDGKAWLSEQAEKLGLKASQLAGLHIHFFLATVLKSNERDLGAFVTSAEWLDVNYGKLLRSLFLNHLGGQGITILEPTASAFKDAITTTAIAQFVVGSKPSTIRMKRVPNIDRKGALTTGTRIHRDRLQSENRWSQLTRTSSDAPHGYVELGELCRVHRGQVTGANRVWIAGRHSSILPRSVLYPSVTRAKELFAAGLALDDDSRLRKVIDIPVDLSIFEAEERDAIDRFITLAKSAGADDTYVAKNRRAWWSVGLRQPAPILATYMARRAPAFVRNLVGARHINIAHGLYPRDSMSSELLDKLASYLAKSVSTTSGRTYGGGLTKFEPKEMERLRVPSPEMLRQMQA
jgi:hypothetical protein